MHDTVQPTHPPISCNESDSSVRVRAEANFYCNFHTQQLESRLFCAVLLQLARKSIVSQSSSRTIIMT